MGIETKDVLLLIAGALLGVPSSMVASVMLGPSLTIIFGFGTVKLLARVRQMMRRDELFDILWTQQWSVTSPNYPEDNHSDLKIYRFLNFIAAETGIATVCGRKYQFRIIATMDRQVITGKWMDPDPSGYYGAFQLLMSPTHEAVNGRWLGFSSKGTVKSGAWVWKPKFLPQSN
jgi:hypothetical protein